MNFGYLLEKAAMTEAMDTAEQTEKQKTATH